MKKLCVTLALMLLTGPAVAQALLDPTRPPNAANPVGDVASAADTGPMLQSVLISRERTLAVIDGKTVKVGDKVGEARLIRIAATEVILQANGEVQVLKLFPDVQKSPSKRQASRPNGEGKDKQ